MKLLISSNSSWTLYNFRFNLMKFLRETGFHVHAVSLEDEYTPKIIDEGFAFHPLRIQGKGANPFADYSLLRQYRQIYHRERPDVVLNFTIKPVIYSTLAAKKYNVPVINNIAGLGNLFSTNTWLTRIAIFLYRVSQKKVDHVFFQNEDDIALFKRLKILKHQSYAKLPGSGVDLQRFTPSTQPPAENHFKFLMFGRMLWDKGVREYAEAATLLKEKYPNATFLLAGLLDFQNPTAVSSEDMQHLMENYNVHYVGKTNRIEDLIEKCHCVVYPSYYREGVPRALLEAAAMGKPLITTGNVGCREVVRDGWNGFGVPVKDSNALAKAMGKMINLAPGRRMQFGENSRAFVEQHFGEQLVFDAYAEQLKQLTGN